MTLPDLPIPATTDRLAQKEIAQALAHPQLAAITPALNGALAIGLGVYTAAYLFVIFSIVF